MLHCSNQVVLRTRFVVIFDLSQFLVRIDPAYGAAYSMKVMNLLRVFLDILTRLDAVRVNS